MQRKPASEHEMTVPAPDNLATALLNSEEANTSRTLPTQRNFKVRDFLRHTRTQILGKAFSPFTDWYQEPRKVAMYRSRRVAAFHCVLHMIPLAGAVTLLVLRWTKYWTSSKPPDATTLQFVAKIHELFMQVSIVEVMLYIIRRQATKGFVPLGVLSGALQATQLSYLWSLDFYSLFHSDAFRGRGWQRAGMVVAIPALLISTALVGPSSAVLMIPESGCPRYLLNDSTIHVGSIGFQSVFPIHSDVTDRLETDKITSVNSTLDNFRPQVMENRDFPGKESEFLLFDFNSIGRMLHVITPEYYALHSISRGQNITWTRISAIATVPTRFASSALDAIRYTEPLFSHRQINITGSITMPQPVLNVTCAARDFDSTNSSDDVYYVSKDGNSIKVLDNMISLARQVKSLAVLEEYDHPRHLYNHFFEPVWLHSPEPDSESPIVVVFTGMSNGSNLRPLSEMLTESELTVYVRACSLSAYWTSAEATFASSQGQLLPVQNRPISELNLRDVRNITLNTTPFEIFKGWEFSKASLDVPEVDLAVAYAILMSSILPSYSGVGIERNLTDYTSFERIVTWFAYGYCNDATSIRLSLAVILAYCIITVSYLVYILVTGLTSTAWASAIELVALALQSRKPNYSGYIAVGIDSIDTFNQSVGIRVNNDNELELVFASDRDIGTMGLRKIEHNKAY